MDCGHDFTQVRAPSGRVIALRPACIGLIAGTEYNGITEEGSAELMGNSAGSSYGIGEVPGGVARACVYRLWLLLNLGLP